MTVDVHFLTTRNPAILQFLAHYPSEQQHELIESAVVLAIQTIRSAFGRRNPSLADIHGLIQRNFMLSLAPETQAHQETRETKKKNERNLSVPEQESEDEGVIRHASTSPFRRSGRAVKRQTQQPEKPKQAPYSYSTYPAWWPSEKSVPGSSYHRPQIRIIKQREEPIHFGDDKTPMPKKMVDEAIQISEMDIERATNPQEHKVRVEKEWKKVSKDRRGFLTLGASPPRTMKQSGPSKSQKEKDVSYFVPLHGSSSALEREEETASLRKSIIREQESRPKPSRTMRTTSTGTETEDFKEPQPTLPEQHDEEQVPDILSIAKQFLKSDFVQCLDLDT